VKLTPSRTAVSMLAADVHAPPCGRYSSSAVRQLQSMWSAIMGGCSVSSTPGRAASTAHGMTTWALVSFVRWWMRRVGVSRVNARAIS
jgi:hypothetical protein